MKDTKRILINYRMEQVEQAIKDTEILLSEGGSPGSIINRAYYAMFYAVLALSGIPPFENKLKIENAMILTFLPPSLFFDL